MAKYNITAEPEEEYFPEYFLFHVPSRKLWEKLVNILDQEDISLKPCKDELFYYEVDAHEQKR